MPRRPGVGANGQERNGRRVAQLFRQARGLLDVRCCNLEAILAEDDIDLETSKVEHPGHAGCLVRTSGSSGIMVPSDQVGGRRRFTIAHELGHFHIPSHKDVNGWCTDSDLRAWEGGPQLLEWEANDFASELLMPARLFGEDVDARAISVASAKDLASAAWYDVSILAAALRMVHTTRQAAALVVSANGRVSWTARSSGFKLYLPGKTDRLHSDTLASAGYRSDEFSDAPLAVPLASWLAHARQMRGELLESTYRIDRLEQVVSLLWHVDGDGEASDG
ncbi:MAG: ImmA/IrrE family metallo-endopeptidase [Gemmatimonadaceae bacterium]|nr:ImmA/IrrE family metallo-endopeptidase [Gemmatimonadaceae bacterium]